MGTIDYLISHYSYAAIFSLLMLGIFGLPIPDETLLTFSGYLVSKGDLHLIPAKKSLRVKTLRQPIA